MADPFRYYDLHKGSRSSSIETIFPQWCPGERVAILSPHDDDAVLGAGYLLLGIETEGGEAHVLIFCDGSAGYGERSMAGSIVQMRKAESVEAYGLLGIPRERIVRFGYADYSVEAHLGWQVPGGRGVTPLLIEELRQRSITRALLPNGYREHWDHHSVFRAAVFDIPQAGDTVAVEWGAPTRVETVLEYTVWGDFSPSPEGLGADRAVTVPRETEDRVLEALGAFRSQGNVLGGLVEARREREMDERFMEVYRTVACRPDLDMAPYRTRVSEIDSREGF